MLVPRDASLGLSRLAPRHGALTVGRGSGGGAVLPLPTVSRHHLRLEWNGEALFADDLGSTGGTYVNGVRIEHCELHPGDLLRVGPRVEFEVAAEVGLSTGSLDLSQLRGTTSSASGQGEELRQLQSLLEVARALNAATVLEDVLSTVLQASVRLLAADRGFVVLAGEEGAREAVASWPPATGLAEGTAQSALLSEAIEGRRTVSAETSVAVRNATLRLDPGGPPLEAVATPLLVARRPLGSPAEASFVGTVEVLGAVLLERRRGARGFAKSETSVLEALAADAATAIDSARLYKQARDKAKIEHEMSLARTIQAALLKRPPAVPFAELHVHFQPAQTVGGDLYFGALRQDGSLAVALGDVSGKGVAAALWMALVEGLLGMLHDLGQPLEELLPALNRNLKVHNPGNRFLTLVTATVAADGRMRIANAGHCEPILLRADGKVETLPAQGPVLGILAKATWGVREVMLAPGDTLLLYSDGVSESAAPDGSEFDVEGISQALVRHARRPLAEQVAGVLDGAAAFRAGRAPADDVTMLALRYRESPLPPVRDTSTGRL